MVTLLETNHDTNRFLPEEEKLLIEYLKGRCKNLGVFKVSDESPEKILQQINCSPMRWWYPELSDRYRLYHHTSPTSVAS